MESFPGQGTGDRCRACKIDQNNNCTHTQNIHIPTCTMQTGQHEIAGTNSRTGKGYDLAMCMGKSSFGKNIFNVQVSQTHCLIKRAEYEPKTTKKELWQISPETSFPLAQYHDQYFTDQSVAYCFLSKTETLFDHVVNALKEKILQKKRDFDSLIPGECALPSQGDTVHRKTRRRKYVCRLPLERKRELVLDK